MHRSWSLATPMLMGVAVLFLAGCWPGDVGVTLVSTPEVLDFGAQKTALTLFLLQLVFNALWSPAFFGLHSPALGLVDISLLWLALLGTVAAFWKARPAAGLLLLPYLAWVTFAGALNFALWRLNA